MAYVLLVSLVIGTVFLDESEACRRRRRRVGSGGGTGGGTGGGSTGNNHDATVQL